MKQPVQDGAYGSGLMRSIVVLFELTQNLRLADDHRIEARRDAKQMAHRIVPPVNVDVIIERFRKPMRSLVVEKSADVVRSGLAITRSRNHLDAITSRQDDAFIDGGILAQAGQCAAYVGALECDAFAHFDGRAAMVQPDDNNIFAHALFEPASMPAGEKRISPKKISEHDAETEHREDRRFLAAQTRGQPGV